MVMLSVFRQDCLRSFIFLREHKSKYTKVAQAKVQSIQKKK